MAGLTKDELKTALVNHGVSGSLSAAKKDELVALYEEFVAPYEDQAGEFSSDDEDKPLKKPSSVKKVSRSSKASKKDKENGENGDLTEDNSLIVGDLKVEELSDEELIAKLLEHAIEVGPIVDSTRALYQKKLAIVLREKARLDEPDSQQNGHAAPEVNGSKKSDLNKSVAEFSADEEEVNEEIEDEEQPSVVVKQSSRTATPTKSLSSKTSPLQALGQSLRQRFSGQKPEKTDRFTPTPRRSIHSYKVTETTKQTMTKSKDGVVSKETTYVKETSDSNEEAGGRSVVSVVLRKVLPGLLLVLILAALAYYISKAPKK